MSDNIIPVAIEDKMKKSYLNYSLSVIVGRALPDVRDGLKPVHRRILYAAQELGLTAGKPHKKSARIVGEVLGKYHPHGDRAVYDAMVRMAQPFNQRYLLIDGHGNFGSMDGDSPAAMRYTEARLTKFSQNMLSDINQKTVDFVDNFDGSLQEPVVLPSRIPNLLVNGSSGIAVGMSTDIPPHNLGEVSKALKYLIKHPGAAVETLINYIPGPDFPTGAKIIGSKGIKKAYKTGKGKIKLRARTKLEKAGRKNQIVVTELPYQINKAKLIENIAELIKKEKLTTISDLRDESDQDGMRIVMELKQGTDSELVLNRLYKYTSLQTNYRINMLALIDNRPEVMNIKTILQHFIDFRRQVVRRRTNFLLEKARKRHHILKGLISAISSLDLVINIIRNSETTEEAREKLQEGLDISQQQAEAILNMKLQRLVGMETERLRAETAELSKKINSYQKILEERQELDRVIVSELNQIKKKFADKRKTELIDDDNQAKIEKKDLIKEKKAVITYSLRGKLKRSDSKENIRAAKNDVIVNITSGISFNTLLFFTDSGQVYSLPVHQIPEHHGLSTGDNLTNYIKIPLKERIIGMTCLNEEIKKKFITLATARGYVKKTIGKEYQTSYTSIKAINLNKNDQVIAMAITDGQQEILLASEKGRTIRFKEGAIADTGRNTIGNMGMNLAKNDRVIDMNIVGEKEYVVTISRSGKANKIDIREFKLQNRNGKGLKTVTADNYRIAAIKTITDRDRLLITDDNQQQQIIKPENILTTQRPGYMYYIKDQSEINVKKVFKLPNIPQ